MSDSYTSKNMLDTKNVWWNFQSKLKSLLNVWWNFQSKLKSLLNHTYFKDGAYRKSVATILVMHVTTLTEPDLSLQN